MKIFVIIAALSLLAAIVIFWAIWFEANRCSNVKQVHRWELTYGCMVQQNSGLWENLK